MKEEDVKIGMRVRVTGHCIHGPTHCTFDGKLGRINRVFEADHCFDAYAGIEWADGNSSLVAFEFMEPVHKFTVGDRVRVMRAWGKREFPGAPFMYNYGEMPKYIGKFGKCIQEPFTGVWRVEFPYGVTWLYPEAVLEPVPKSHTARILTEKIMVGEVPCRRILAFEGIREVDELPCAYVDGKPAFWLSSLRGGAHLFQDGKMTWGCSGKGNYTDTDAVHCEFPEEPDCGAYAFTGLHEKDVWPETEFQTIRDWMKKAGDRLAKIRKEEREAKRAAWSGKETIEI